MTQSRLLLVVLIVLGLVFALGIGLGATNKEKEPNDNVKNDYAKDFGSEGLSGLLTKVLSPFFPKLQYAEIKDRKSKSPLTQKRFPSFNKNVPLVLDVSKDLPEPWIPVRQAVMVRKRGSVKILFKSPIAEKEDLRKQCIPSKKDCSDAQPSKWDEGDLTIPEEGGTLTLTCGDDASCRVELKES